MAVSTTKFQIDVRVSFTVDEDEARALDALAGYGEDAFIKAFYDRLGEAYMRKHEDGLRRFLRTIRDVTNPALAGVDKARACLSPNKSK